MYISASAPEAPPLSETTIGCFINLFFWMAACIIRAIWSEAPPAPAATTISTGFVGSHASACAPSASPANAATPAANVLSFIPVSSGVFKKSQSKDKRRRVEALAAFLLNVAIKLVDQRSDRKGSAIALGLLEADAEILPHPVHREAEIELARVHRLA